MSKLRESVRHYREMAGQSVGQVVGQGGGEAVPLGPVRSASVGQDFPQNSAENEGCPTVPLLRGRDSGTEALSPVSRGTDGGTNRGTCLDPRIAEAHFREWRAVLSRLDPCQPRGMPMGRWRSLYDASLWWLAGFGEQAARDGWSTGCIFGLWPDKPGWGGLIDRLGDNRSLVMTADSARWRSFGVPEKFNRGSYPKLAPWWGS